MNRAHWTVIAAAIALLPGIAVADEAKLTWTQFVDPAEHAMAIDVPTGWAVKGGVMRINAFLAQPWVQAVSPDGSIEVFIADPTLPGYQVTQQRFAEGTMVPADTPGLPPNMALDYRPAAEFAKYYAPVALANAGCADAQLTGTQPMPDIAKLDYDRAVAASSGFKTTNNIAFPHPPHEAGLATFTCQSGGRTLSAGVIADTTQPGQQPFWSAGVSGYLTTSGQEDWALAILKHMITSVQANPQWQQAMQDAAQDEIYAIQNHIKQVGDTAMAQLLQTEQAGMAAIKAQGAADMQTLTAGHQAFMAQMNEQAAAHNASFAAYEAQKGLNNWNFIAHEVRNGALYRDTSTGRIFEVDN